MNRKIVHIDEEKCNGCGLCAPNCAEGALKIINGKAKLVSDVYCDGLGACLGHCPQGAITIIERQAQEFDEKEVKKLMQGKPVHASLPVVGTAQCAVPTKSGGFKEGQNQMKHFEGCPGSRIMEFKPNENAADTQAAGKSQLRQWPVQLHLISPEAPYYQKADVLLSADCVAYALADFHKDYLKGKALAIACPKLDEGHDVYIEKIKSLVDDAKINTLTIMIMQVPCCGGLVSLAKEAIQTAKRKIPVKSIVVGLQGDILSEEWL